MFYENIKGVLTAMLDMWVQYVSINSASKDLYMPLIDASWRLMNESCVLIHVPMEDLLRIWEEEEFKIDEAVERVIKEYFEVVQE